MKYRWIAAVGALAAAAAFLVAGCGGGGSSSGTSGLQLLLSDAPIDARAVDITISRIDVSRDGEGWTTIRTFEPELTINLLDYRYDGDDSTPEHYLLADTPLEPGRYTQIRLILTRIEIEDFEGNRFPCEMNSQDITGLKIVGEFDVAEGTKSAVLLDFDAGRSIVAMGNGGYRLKPTVRVVPMQLAGSVKGVIEFNDLEGAALPVPEGVTVVASQGGEFVAASPVIADGSFRISGLTIGTYDIALEYPEGTTATHELPATSAVVTAGTETDLGTLTAVPVP